MFKIKVLSDVPINTASEYSLSKQKTRKKSANLRELGVDEILWPRANRESVSAK